MHLSFAFDILYLIGCTSFVLESKLLSFIDLLNAVFELMFSCPEQVFCMTIEQLSMLERYLTELLVSAAASFQSRVFESLVDEELFRAYIS